MGELDAAPDTGKVSVMTLRKRRGTAESGDYRFRGTDTSAVGRRGRSFAGPFSNLSAGLSSLLVGSPPSWMINGSAKSAPLLSRSRPN